jgi:hypothetical protein
VSNYKKIQFDYKTDLEWIYCLNSVPSEVKKHVAALKKRNYTNKNRNQGLFCKASKEKKKKQQ